MSLTRGDTSTAAVGPPAHGAVDPVEVRVGGHVGRFVVLEEVGVGGMGRVLRAYDPKLQREVALKEVRPGLDRDATSRLVSEARAMAKLSHPNVVAVFDVEERGDDVTPSTVVIVMEYVPGTTLKTWSADKPRTWREIRNKFVEAGRGLAAAHAAGILHRDFKPANVLVGDAPETPVKVTDFGLAKVGSTSRSSPRSSDDANEEGITREGAVLGTPPYMSPEQRAGAALTPATDQYSFCVALWEALCGGRPFSRAELLTNRRPQPPAWPDPSVPRRLGEALRRGLSPDPADRWPSMASLLDALAFDPDRRRLRSLFAATVVVATGVASTGWWVWADARNQRCGGAEQQLQGVWDPDRRADVEASIVGTGLAHATRVGDQTTRDLDLYVEDWAAMYTEACAATAVRAEQSAEVMDLRMACLRRAKVDLDAAAGVLSDADAVVVTKAHEIVAKLRDLDRCADIEALRADVEPPEAGIAPTVDDGRALLAQARVARYAARPLLAQRKVGEARDAVGGVDYPPVHIEVALEQGRVFDALGKYEDAEAASTRGLDLALRQHRIPEMQQAATDLLHVVGVRQVRPQVALDRYRALAEGLAADDGVALASAQSRVAGVLAAMGKYKEAEAMDRVVLTVRQELLGRGHPNVAATLDNLGSSLTAQGKHAEAEGMHRRALEISLEAVGPEHPDVADSLSNIARTLSEQGEYAKAEAEFRRALAITQKAFGPEHPETAAMRSNLATSLEEQAKYAEAEAEHRQALALREKVLAQGHPDIADSHNNLGAVLDAQGKYAEAEAEHRRSLALREAALGPDHPFVGVSHSNIANALSVQGDNEEAETHFRRAIAIFETRLGPEHLHVASARNSLGVVLQNRREFELAQAEHRKALAIREKALRPGHPLIASACDNLGNALHRGGQYEEAEAAHRRALEIREKSLGLDHPLTKTTQTNLAITLRALGRPDERP